MEPIRFAFGVHLHQPVGNFDQVFAQHVDDVYRPLLETLAERDFLPIIVHLSGPLLEWLEQHDPAYLDRLGHLVADGRVEMLLAGFYEPVLAALPRADRVEQIQWMREAIHRRFGVEASGLWLTERVWEPEVAADLARAGVRYALVDDRHFLVSGFAADQLHAPYWTESGGEKVVLFPIDERLRYLIPFRPPGETADYLRSLHQAGHRLAVLADDGEKFGGWPGTREWVYGKGWLDRFVATLGGLIDQGEVRLSRLDDALATVPSGGIAYLPTASYREMETWSLPPDAALRLTRLEHDLGEVRTSGPDGALLRGSHWRNFLVRYPESNRMHKKMQALSTLCRKRRDPGSARRAIARAQCNDAYWHGVFGGLYLPHLRDAVWRNLASAEGELRRGKRLSWEILDLDGDGHDEIWIHSGQFSALVSPWRGGAIEEYTVFELGINFANTLTRRREAYHDLALQAEADAAGDPPEGTASIHDIEHQIRLSEAPPLDQDDRAILVDRILPRGLERESFARGDFWYILSWARQPMSCTVQRRSGGIEIACTVKEGRNRLEKRMRFGPDGWVGAEWVWDPAAADPDDVFSTELSLAAPLGLQCRPAADEWRFEIETVAKSERGLDHTRQGESVTLRWPVRAGEASLDLLPLR